MPVIPSISEAVKLSLKLTPDAPSELVGSVTSASQVVMSLSSLQMVGTIPMPVIPFGSGVSQILTKLEAMVFEFYTQMGKMIQMLLNQYISDLTKAQNQRKQAEEELYQSLLDKQQWYKEEMNRLKKENIELEEKNIDLQNQFNTIVNNIYEKKLLYSLELKKAIAINNNDKINYYTEELNKLNSWNQILNDLQISITQNNINIFTNNITIQQYKTYLEYKIIQDWDQMIQIATIYAIPIPYYPDLPQFPNLPTLPKLPMENMLSKIIRQVFAKWISTPTIPPIGLLISALQMLVQSMNPNIPAQTSAKLESQIDALILQLGGCI